MRIQQTNAITYLSPDRCSSRDLEVKNNKNKKTLEIEGSTLKVAEHRGDLVQEARTLFEVEQALKRRGLALHSWQVHEKYLLQLLQHLSIDPPPGYSRITLYQLLKADEEAWSQAATKVRSVKRDSLGSLPLDVFFESVWNIHLVNFHLLPQPATKVQNKQDRPAGKADGKPSQGWYTRQQQQPYSTGKGKGKSKGKGQKQGPRIPKELYSAGCSAFDESGAPICLRVQLGPMRRLPRGSHMQQRPAHLCKVLQGSLVHQGTQEQLTNRAFSSSFSA